MRRIHPAVDLAAMLKEVEKPARYVGGEFASVRKDGEHLLTVALSYPDLYEIGMSNSAIRILYSLLNSLEGVACERVFAAAPDFEAALRSRAIPLYSLESGLALADFDILGFSLGYELTMTNALSILDLGGIPIRPGDRRGAGPVVIAGGPACTNPVPYGIFADCVFIGEAEGWAAEVFPRLALLKKAGAGRADFLEALRGEPAMWHPGKSVTTGRALWRGFATVPARAGFPVPGMRVVQDHGTVEIMRGCPNACKFCHATCYYRPTRLKDPAVIAEEARGLVREAGYREISLSSLSSGDFREIHPLVRGLNARYARDRVSFSLPSLRVDSLGLALLSEISEVRKSGLTFAVETALPQWQSELRKAAPLEKIVSILTEARSLGWKSAKFYFMVGLPASAEADEAGPIVDFLREVRGRTRMSLTVNLASFIPKPHTPYERAAQLGEEPALQRIMAVKKGAAGDGFKIGYHAPILSILEGIVARGDERAGELVLEAFRAGARLDAWEEHIKVDLWRRLIAAASWDVIGETCRRREPDERLPWDGVDLRLSASVAYEAPAPHAAAAAAAAPEGAPAAAGRREGPASLTAGSTAAAVPPRALFSFAKHGRAAYLSHLDLMGVFERALARGGIRASFTEGFNPKPRLEFASPLGLGIESEEEIASIELEEWGTGTAFCEALNRGLPEGLEVTRAELIFRGPSGKKPSLMAGYWGGEYRAVPPAPQPALQDLGEAVELSRTGEYSLLRLPAGAASKELLKTLRARPDGRLLRTRTLAASPQGPASYFEAFRSSALT
jgi:radical SAM superfamily enzyme YgiQ (UPF0313 family)